VSAQPGLARAASKSHAARPRTARPIPVELRIRAFPAIPPHEVKPPETFPERVLLAEVAIGPDGRGISGVYLGDGPDLGEVAGRFLGPAAPPGFDPAGAGPLRDRDDFLDRLIWRLLHESRFGGLMWEPAAFFSSLAVTFRHEGRWVVLWTYLDDNGEHRTDYYRPPIILEPLANGRVTVRFGPRKKPDPRDFDKTGRQYPGRFAGLQDAVSALVGERVQDLATACRLFGIEAPPPGPATVEALPERIVALRELYRAVREEAECWPGVSIDHLPSAAALVSGAYVSAGTPQPLLRDRRTMRVPPRAIGAGIEAASIGARTGTSIRRQAVPGLDVDVTACYPVAGALASVQDFLTHEVAAHHLHGRRSLAELTARVAEAVASDVLEHPDAGRSLAFLCKVAPAGDVMTVHVELFGTEATVTAPIVEGSREFWTTGFDLAAAVLEDLDRGGPGSVPEIVEAWTFTFGRRLRGLHPVTFPGGWTWDPRTASTYRSRDGRTRGNLYLLFAAMRAVAKTDPTLSEPERIRRRGMLKVASVAGAFGMFCASTPLDVKPGTRHRVITADGIVTLDRGTPERPGPWAFPPAAALVEGAGRLLLTLLVHEARVRGGIAAQIDTDGGFIVATAEGGLIDEDSAMIPALSFAQVQEIRERFATLARWTGLPITSDRLEGRRVVTGEGMPSLVKFADPMVGEDGKLGDFLCYTPSLRRFAIHPDDGGDVDGRWRVSENTIGVMVNPSSLRQGDFARDCYRYLLARETGDEFDADWLDEPVLWPKTITHPDDLVAARRAIPDLRPTETVVYARPLFGGSSYVARPVLGASWRDLDWRTQDGEPVGLTPAVDRAAGAVRTWRVFLRGFLRHPVAFTLDAEGHRSDGSTCGLLVPAPILIVGATRTGRTDWATGQRAEDLVLDPGEWSRIMEGLAGIGEADLVRAGLAPRTARAMRAGRQPIRRNAEKARRLVAERTRAKAGLVRDRARGCIAPGCGERLTGRQRTFCTRHAAFPGTRRKAWREAAR